MARIYLSAFFLIMQSCFVSKKVSNRFNFILSLGDDTYASEKSQEIKKNQESCFCLVVQSDAKLLEHLR